MILADDLRDCDMTSLEKILKFIEFTHEIQSVERAIYIRGKERKENDMEHQYQLAMLAWYIIVTEKLKLDKEKVIQYALIHDIVEAYAGDTFFFGPRNGKAKRERAAAKRLVKEFPEFKDLHRMIEKYEHKKDKESRFVYALDKILPICNIYFDNGRLWKESQVSLPLLLSKKKAKVAVAPELKPYYKELTALLKLHEKDLFISEV